MADILMERTQVQKDKLHRPVKVELFLNTDQDYSYGELSVHGYTSYSKYVIDRGLVVKTDLSEKAQVLAQGFLQSNGFWNFILADTREPFSATGFKDLYDAEVELIKYFVLKNDCIPVEAESPVIIQRAASFPSE